MESGKAHTVAPIAVVLALLVPQLASSARRPIAGGRPAQRADAFRSQFISGKKTPISDSLLCCGDCKHFEDFRAYYCDDSAEKAEGCKVGCEVGSCGSYSESTCTCDDLMDSCPLPCDSFFPTSGKDSGT